MREEPSRHVAGPCLACRCFDVLLNACRGPPANRAPTRPLPVAAARPAATLHPPLSSTPHRPHCRPRDLSYAPGPTPSSHAVAPPPRPPRRRCFCCFHSVPFRARHVRQAFPRGRPGLPVLCERLAHPYALGANNSYVALLLTRASLPCREISQRAAGEGRLQAD